MQLYGSHVWLLKGLAALARTEKMIGEPPGTSFRYNVIYVSACMLFRFHFSRVVGDIS